MLRNQVQELVEQAVIAGQADASLPAIEMPQVEIARPKQPEHGDYSTNIAMVTAAAIRKATESKPNPRQIAQAIVDHMPDDPLISAAEIAGPGFINLRLAEEWLQEQVAAIVAAGDEFGTIDQGAGQRWQVEHVSANPTGPIHYGGARNAVLGDTLANVLEAAGYEVQREFYVNDGGTQFRLFIETLYARYAQLLGRDEPIPADGYQGDYMLDYAQQIVEEAGDRFLRMPRDAALTELRPLGRALVLVSLEEELAGMGVRYDNWFSEQTLYDEGLIEQSLNYLQERGELVKRDGAVWFLASNYPKHEKDVVVIRSNGQPTYFAGDIAYHYDKFLRRHFDKVIDVWAVDHQGHVPRMNAMMQAFGLDPDRLVILMYDLVKLIEDGKEKKLSKRAGNIITIQEVVEQVGADALRFNLLTRGPESTIEFDMDLAVREAKENPVFYVQYSHARICSMLDKARKAGFAPAAEFDEMDHSVLALLSQPSELALIRKLLEMEEQIATAVEKLSPHNLTYYAMDVAKAFNSFYRDARVIDPDAPALSQARVYLSQATQVVLARTLGLLGITAPQEMWRDDVEIDE
ncbi:MAG: arginine--tRNA ligase [Caldilineaceae bacterium]|nr:arginine--tRNA ligase [Caldilineaceae bacterium]